MGVTIQDIIARLNMPAWFESQGVVLGKQRGNEYRECGCPLCGDPKHFDFNILSSKWICNKCGEAGNIVTLASKTRKVPSGEAFKQLIAEAGLDNEEAIQRPRTNRARGRGQGGPQSNETAPVPSPAVNQTAAAIYSRFVELTTLTDIHRMQLKEKRGFTSATIDTFKLRSGGPQVAGIITKLSDEFSPQDLVRSGILVEANGNTTPNQQLLEDRVIIPYLDQQGLTYHLRPHKLGFGHVPVQPFSRQTLSERPQHIILTEGEFKAIALHQSRIPAVAIPGVGSFGKKNLPRLVELLKEFGIGQVTIVFDSEEKGNPDYPNYKPRAESRYDTQVWAYIMAYELGRNGFVARVGELPAEWRQKGKVDWDGALAAGHTRDEFLEVIGRAATAAEYRDSLPEEARRVVNRKVSQHFARLNINREINRYVATHYRGNQATEDVISNFVIEIRSSFFTPDGVIRNVQLVNEYGETSATFPLDPTSMAGVNEFKKFLLSKGNYLFEGSAGDLVNVWKFEFSRDSGEFIYMPDRIGQVEPGLWLFGNVAIKDGKAYLPDNEGIFWVDSKGYKPQSLQVGQDGKATEDAIPALSQRPLDIVEAARHFRDAVGGYEAYIGLGWAIATLFSEDIFAEYRCLPILFAHGKRASGKSTYARWIMNVFGIETDGYALSETTQNFIARALSYYGSLGTWFDEYRNDPKVTQKDGYLRSAYNRQLSGKGTATAFQAKGFSVHGAMLVSGEELPRDSALYTRLVPVQLSTRKRDRDEHDWMNRHARRLSSFTREVLLDYAGRRGKVMEAIAELRAALIEKDVDERIATNWAICAGAFDACVLGAEHYDEEFTRWVEAACQEVKETGESEHLLSIFWEDVSLLISTGDLDDKFMKVSDGKLQFWFPAVYNVWAGHYRKTTGREPFDKLSIRKYLYDEAYYAGQANVRLKQSGHRVDQIDLSLATDTIKEAAEALAAIEGMAPPGQRGWGHPDAS